MNNPLQELFAVQDGYLVRSVTPTRGSPYQHRCPQAAFEAVARSIAATRTMSVATFSLEVLVARTGLPHTQVATALAFLKERGIAVPTFKRMHRAGSDITFEEAMIEYHALREKGPNG